MLVSRATQRWIVFIFAIILTLNLYRFRWGILGNVIGPPERACSDIEALNAYLDTGGRPSAYLGRSPLIVCAAEAGAYDVVSRLIDQDVDINAQITSIPLPIMFEDIGSTALYVSIREGHSEIAELLFKNGADVNLSGAAGSPLNIAIRRNQSQLLELFLQSDAVVYEFDEGRILTVARDGNLEIFKFLFEEDFRRFEEEIPLEEVYARALATAASEGRIEIVSFLFNEGIPIDGEGISTGSNGLHRSAKSNHIEVVRFLISAGVDVNSVDEERNTPLHYTAISNAPEAARMLIESGADINLENNEGKTPLDVSIENDSLEVVNVLESSGASIQDCRYFIVKEDLSNVVFPSTTADRYECTPVLQITPRSPASSPQ